MVIKMTSLIDFFDPHNLEHMKAYGILINSGTWPEGFIPETVEFPAHWHMLLALKLADAWMEYSLTQIKE